MADTYEIATTLGLKRSYRDYIGDCPSCGYGDAFSLNDDHGTPLFHCHAGCTQAEVMAALRHEGLWGKRDESSTWQPAKVANSANKADDAERTRQALTLWEASQPVQGSPVERYLSVRGLHGELPAIIRYLPGGKHKNTNAYYPVMLCGISRWPSPAIVAVHRTFLSVDGGTKANIQPDKMSLGPIGGASVQLAPPGAVLAVAEGIETALSIQQATGIPTWAALSTGGIKGLLLPDLPLAREIIIGVDHDTPGFRAVYAVADHWSQQGRIVRIAYTPDPGSDFNDLLQKKGG